MERLTLFNFRQTSYSNEPKTYTTIEQVKTATLIKKAYYEKLSTWKDDALKLFKHNHIGYVKKRLIALPSSLECLDASQPWLAYWMVHSLRLMNFDISDDIKQHIIAFCKSTQHPNGGFAGGPYQFAHLATTYGALNCLASLCKKDALDCIDRGSLLTWLNSLHQSDGSFVMHIGGESDVRGAYCAVAVARLTGLLKRYPATFEHTAEWIANCQTYEGGFGGRPGLEAHGGYTFCAIAALCMLDKPELIDLRRLIRWVACRQMATEGGFQGRTNKLVDSCYSFWQGAVFPIVENLLQNANDPALSFTDTLMNPSALQEYILLCCQKVSYTRPGLSVPNDHYTIDSLVCSGDGGLIDKPGRNPDAYHTCYALSGLSIAQHTPRTYNKMPIELSNNHFFNISGTDCFCPTKPVDLLGENLGNELADIDPLQNIRHDGLLFTLTYFNELDQGCSKELAEQKALEVINDYQHIKESTTSPNIHTNTNATTTTTTDHEWYENEANHCNQNVQNKQSHHICTTP